ncbi:LuxR C-terminal-related transcriptional regulator [Kiloniella sp. EL199]|uniref:helix-turn-helix transcriptional regulator n=1 Tax=Kiloniella sp. EL199 TaxID=2107581 RepID=UPI0013C42D08|nr:LuxR C-terminal-related transcriptional regulator [Kiloniella sp. EL199]
MNDNLHNTSQPFHERAETLWGLLIIQIICTLFFLSDAIGDLFFAHDIFAGFDHDIIELLVVIALSVSIAFTVLQIQQMLQRQRRIEEQIKIASGAFITMLDQYFEEWKLTPAEQDVALFLIKGMSFTDIANLRQTREGTVKAQCNAIYNKAKVTGRSQLLSFFIEELLNEELIASS